MLQQKLTKILHTKQKLSIPFWFITLSIVFGLTLSVLIQDAMFQDAVLYSSVSHNLGIGIGTFWFPQYSTLNLENISSFHEQPPLVFGIQSLFFRLLGDSIYVERFYVFLTIILHILLINKLWKMIFKNNPDYKNLGWLPTVFWILIPVCFWSFRNNMLVNTVSVFTLISIIISYKQIQSQKNSLFFWIISGFFIFLASFSKGVPGFFPVAFPFFYWLITRKISLKRSVFFTLILLSVPFVFYLIFMIHPESRQSLTIYAVDRLLNRVNTMPTADYRLETAWRLFTEMIPILIISIFILFFTKRTKLKAYFFENIKESLLFLAIGLSGSYPLMLTMVQKGWYMVPSFPYFAISLAILVTPSISVALKRINIQSVRYKFFKYISISLFLACIIFIFMQSGKISRHEEMVTDVYEIGTVVPKFSTLTVPQKMYNQYDFKLQGFLVRYCNISISPYKEYDYFLKEKKSDSKIPENYNQKVELDLTVYELYRK